MTIAWGKGSLFAVSDRVILGHRFQCRVDTKTLEGIYGLHLDEQFTFDQYSVYLDEYGVEALTQFVVIEARVLAINTTEPRELIPHVEEIVDSFKMFCRRARAGNSTTDPA